MALIDINECSLSKYKYLKRALCLDYGNKRIGVALSDIGWTIASPLTVLDSHGVFPKLLSIISKNNAGLIVVGWPLALNGGENGLQLLKVKKFIEKLQTLVNIDILLWDERLSTAGAINSISEYNLTRRESNKIIDKISASFILTGFLDHIN